MKKIITCISVAILHFSGISQAQDNQWITVNPIFYAPEKFPGVTLSSYNSWTSLKYNTRDSSVIAWRMILDAQRHNGIYANSLVLWNLRSNRIDLITASNYAGGTYDPSPSFTLMPEFATDTTPCPRHPYDAIAYVDSLHAVYLLLGATPRIVNFEGSPGNTPQNVWDAHELDGLSTWKYSFKTGRWYRIPQNIRRFWPSPYYCGSCVPFHDNHLVYWKSAHKLLFIDLYGRHAAVMDLTTEIWDTLALINTAPFEISSPLCAWDSKRERMVLRAGDSVCYFDPAERRFTQLPNCGLDIGSGRPTYTGIAYITKHDVYLAVGRDGTTRVFNIATQSWHTVASGSIGLDAGEGNLQMEYDPATDRVVLSTAGSGVYGGFRTFHYVPDATVKNRQPVIAAPVSGITIRPNLPCGSVTISLSGAQTPTTISIYSVNGKRMIQIPADVRSLERGVTWHAASFPSGNYYVVIKQNNQVLSKSFLLVK